MHAKLNILSLLSIKILNYCGYLVKFPNCWRLFTDLGLKDNIYLPKASLTPPHIFH